MFHLLTSIKNNHHQNDNWNILKKWEALYIALGDDEEFVEKYETINGEHYVTIITDHFSPYAIAADSSNKSESKPGPTLQSQSESKIEKTTLIK